MVFIRCKTRQYELSHTILQKFDYFRTLLDKESCFYQNELNFDFDEEVFDFAIKFILCMEEIQNEILDDVLNQNINITTVNYRGYIYDSILDIFNLKYGDYLTDEMNSIILGSIFVFDFMCIKVYQRLIEDIIDYMRLTMEELEVIYPIVLSKTNILTAMIRMKGLNNILENPQYKESIQKSFSKSDISIEKILKGILSKSLDDLWIEKTITICYIESDRDDKIKIIDFIRSERRVYNPSIIQFIVKDFPELMWYKTLFKYNRHELSRFITVDRYEVFFFTSFNSSSKRDLIYFNFILSKQENPNPDNIAYIKENLKYHNFKHKEYHLNLVPIP